MSEAFVIDIGGTKTNVCLVTSQNSEIKILNSEIFPTNLNPENEIQKIVPVCSKFNSNINQMSLSLPGLWDKNGILQESLFLKNYIGYPFITNLKDNLKIRDCIWETDVICGALGEYEKGKYYSKSLLYINLGTGIGASYIDSEGKVFKSKSNLTLRLQKLVFPFEEEIYSSIDLICGATMLSASKHKSTEELYKAYKLADIEALDLIGRAQIQLAALIINLFYLLAPDVIVLNGGLTYDWEVLAHEAIEIANEEFGSEVARPRILPSKLKEMAPIYGAYVNYCQKVRSRDLTF